MKLIRGLVIVEGEHYVDATLTDEDTILIHMEDGVHAVNSVFDLDQARQIHATLGHLLWVADNPGS